MAKYRINGKFVSFKQFIKTFGSDAVAPSSLTDKEKRILRGVETAAKRARIDGRFVPKVITSNPGVKQAAKDAKMSVNQYLMNYIDDVKEYLETGVFTITKNTTNLHDFIDNHKGLVLYKGKAVDRAELKLKLDGMKQKSFTSKRKNVSEVFYTFEISSDGRTINLVKVKDHESPKKSS